MTNVFSWQNSVSLCPASFCTPRPNLRVTPGISWLPSFTFHFPVMKSTSFFLVLVPEGLYVFIESFNLSFFCISGWGIDLDCCYIEWVALETNRDHFVVFEITPRYCILDFFFFFFDHEGYFISSKGFLEEIPYTLVHRFLRCQYSLLPSPAWVEFSHSVMSDSLQCHGLQHARSPCLSPTTKVYSNSCPSSQWCHPTISSSVVPFSSHLEFFPASGSFPTNQFFASGAQSIGVSASPSVLQDWSPLGWTGLILQAKGLSRVFSNSTVQKHQFFGTQLSLWSNSQIHTWPLDKPYVD